MKIDEIALAKRILSGDRFLNIFEEEALGIRDITIYEGYENGRFIRREHSRTPSKKRVIESAKKVLNLKT